MKHKKKLMAILFFILAIGFAAANFYIANSTKEITEIVVLRQEQLPGTLITDSMLTTKEVGSFNLGSGVIKEKSAIVGQYTTMKLSPLRTLYQDNFDSNAKNKGFEQLILNQAVAIKTDLVASVAAEIKQDTIVQLALVKKTQEGSAQIFYPEELAKVRVLKITMDSGAEINGEEQEKTVQPVAQEEQKRPATLILDITKEQAEMLLPYTYVGAIHCMMLNDKDAQAYREKIGI